jgi:hypothetical protein
MREGRRERGGVDGEVCKVMCVLWYCVVVMGRASKAFLVGV